MFACLSPLAGWLCLYYTMLCNLLHALASAGLGDVPPFPEEVRRCAERCRLFVPLDARTVVVVRLEAGDGAFYQCLCRLLDLDVCAAGTGHHSIGQRGDPLSDVPLDAVAPG
jgi:hypothetical protein